MNCITYTAVFGARDTVADLQWFGDPESFVCYTDQKVENPKIKVINCSSVSSDLNRTAKLFKLFPHLFFPQYDYSIWVDGNMRIKEAFNPEKLIQTYLAENDLALYAHPERNCVYEECKVCVKLKADAGLTLLKQRKAYEKEKMPKRFGLWACGFLVRQHNNKALQHFEELWADQIKKYSKRDQISFAYTVWKNAYKVKTLPGSCWDNENFKVQNH